jgi:hypothetical protein
MTGKKENCRRLTQINADQKEEEGIRQDNRIRRDQENRHSGFF